MNKMPEYRMSRHFAPFHSAYSLFLAVVNNVEVRWRRHGKPIQFDGKTNSPWKRTKYWPISYFRFVSCQKEENKGKKNLWWRRTFLSSIRPCYENKRRKPKWWNGSTRAEGERFPSVSQADMIQLRRRPVTGRQVNRSRPFPFLFQSESKKKEKPQNKNE